MTEPLVVLLADEAHAEPMDCDRCPARGKRRFRVRIGAQEEQLCWGCWDFVKRAYGVGAVEES